MAAPNPTSTKRFQQTQAQVDEVVDIMRMNVDRVLERDAKLSQLDDRADALQMGASQFEQSSGQLKRKMAWKNLKMTIILAVVVGLLLLAIVVWIAVKVKPDTVEILPYFTKPVETTLKTTTEAVPDVTNK